MIGSKGQFGHAALLLLQIVELTLRRLTINIDERLLLKLLQFFGYIIQEEDLLASNDDEDLNECHFEAQR